MMTDAVFNKSRAAPMMDTIQGMDFSQSFVVLRLLMSKPVLLTVPNVPHAMKMATAMSIIPAMVSRFVILESDLIANISPIRLKTS